MKAAKYLMVASLLGAALAIPLGIAHGEEPNQRVDSRPANEGDKAASGGERRENPTQPLAEGESSLSGITPTSRAPSEPDYLVPLGDLIDPLDVPIAGETSVRVSAMQGHGASKTFVLFPHVLTEPVVYTSNGEKPLFTLDGKINAEALGDETIEIGVRVTDVLESPPLAKKLVENMAKLTEGKSIAHLRQEPELWVVLMVEDPLSQNQVQSLGACRLNRMPGKVFHELRFQLHDASDIATLRSADRSRIFVEVSAKVYCKATTEILSAEAASTCSAIGSLVNEVEGKTGAQTLIVALPGGDLDSKAKLKTFVRRSVEATIAKREGFHVPAEVIAAVTNPVVSQAFKTVDLQGQDQNRMVALVLSHGYIGFAPLGRIRGAIDTSKRMLETRTVQQVADASKNEGGLNFFRIGVNFADAEQHSSMNDNLRRDLEEASKTFAGDLPAVTAMTAETLADLATLDAAFVNTTLVNFTVRWQTIAMRRSFESVPQIRQRLGELEKERSELMATRDTKLAAISSVASEQNTAAVANAKTARAVLKVFPDLIERIYFVGNWQGYAAWEEHLFGLGVHAARGVCASHQHGAHAPGVSRGQYRDASKVFIATWQPKTKDALKAFAAWAASVQTRSESIQATLAEIHIVNNKIADVSAEIEMLLRMGAR